jgi:hypothetical protein
MTTKVVSSNPVDGLVEETGVSEENTTDLSQVTDKLHV